MRQRLVQEQTLQRKMNQQLLQAIHILQFSSLELIEHIQEISKENPLIEEINYDYDIAQYRSSISNQHTQAIGEINPAEETMYEKLKQQLITLDFPDKLRPMIEYGIDSLDDDGYLTITMDHWAKEFSTTIDKTEHALNLIQTLEPAGIAARSLSECIMLQLRNFPGNEPFIENLLNEHLDWIAGENIEEIAKYYNTSNENVIKIIEQIKSCHPKPGQLLAVKKAEYIIPEASIYKEKGMWKISFYKWNSPVIEINQEYAGITDFEKEAADYLKEKYKQIDQLNQAILYRTNTLELVVGKIVEKQYMFFEHGAFMMQPLTLKEIANELNLNISTISRSINGKYVQTKQGVLPIKFFFQSGIRQQNGKHTASYAVKQLILEMVHYEEKPLSDEAIKNKLNDEFGIAISRRTVMKYRSQLNIPSSQKRKK